VLRYQECLTLLRDRRLRQGSVDTLAAHGVTTGLFADWLRTMLLNLEGEAHQRQRRLVSKGSPNAVSMCCDRSCVPRRTS
jgi:cytochrome P450